MNTSKWMDIRIRFRHILFSVIALVILISIATIGFMNIEELSFFDAFYLTIISLMTVGYGDIVPESEAGKQFALLLIPIGAAIVTYALGAVASYFIEHQLSVKVWNKRMEHTIRNLEDHIIVCGLGKVGTQIYHELNEQDTPVVYIHEDEEELVDALGEHALRIVGNPTWKSVLQEAGVENARAVIAAMPNDSDNVFLTITAKGLNEDVQVVAKSEREESEEVLLRAGANKVVNPTTIGGREMVMSVLKPEGTDVVNFLIESKNKEFTIEELELLEGSPLIGKSIGESKLRNEHKLTILAIKREDEMIANPTSDEKMEKGDKLVVFGHLDRTRNFLKKS
ncbi:potassium channel family protein [Paenisporosarcina cavernae]|uniref:Potassium channel protein n=1 Tax=Paenisporosarcina cavernae TaxID=2320858 RepID=A0A385YT57_9BACL|nr:potassium channel protein [Paenisporosarcina cavernae]AYC28653.1 potassium channel protein [Paenisporosarcina cavernae]